MINSRAMATMSVAAADAIAGTGEPGAPSPDDRRLRTLLDTWRRLARTSNVAHLRATDTLSWRNFTLGGFAAVSGALVGLSVFATLQSSQASAGMRIAAGVASFAAAGSGALWKYLDYGTRVAAHREASRGYGILVRDIDQALSAPEPITEAVASDIRQQIDKVDLAAPNVPTALWGWAVTAVAGERELTQDAITVSRGALPRVKRLATRLVT